MSKHETGKSLRFIFIFGSFALWAVVRAEETRITIQADQPAHRISPYLTGACLEDVNHEVYGGIYSQMLFGESFQEPPIVAPLKDFHAYGGNWRIEGRELEFAGQPGDKLLSDYPAFSDGEVGVEFFVKDKTEANVGLIVRTSRAGMGAGRFDGYEISLNAADQKLRLGRHKQNWELIQDVPCQVAVGKWIGVVVRLRGSEIEASVDGNAVLNHDDGNSTLREGGVGVRAFQDTGRYRNFWVKVGEKKHDLTFEPAQNSGVEISGMWDPEMKGSAKGVWRVEKEAALLGRQSQRITLTSGDGELGVANRGLNRWGLGLIQGQTYDGILWAHAATTTRVSVSLESRDGLRVYASRDLPFKAGDWQRLEFRLKPNTSDPTARFTISLKRRGELLLGYALLQPGNKGRFNGLPVRRDVAEGLIHQGITVLRYGGSMVNHPGYRWKHMIGPRDRRQPYTGTWYPHSSNGWGIFDFLDFCEAANFLAIPAVNMGESPQDMVDFIDYANGPTTSEWGGRRATYGHPRSYGLRYLELGNEERVDEVYFQKFKPLAEAIWARDPGIVLIVGDFAYQQPITNAFEVTGADSQINSLSAQQKILQLAKDHGREVWFDLHVWTDGPRPTSTLEATLSYVTAMEKLVKGARFKVVVLELNANNHSQRRALANAVAIQTFERDGRIPIATSANCLQPDGQNDNGWDQGLLFLNSSQVWLQPPGYVTSMMRNNYLPLSAPAQVQGSSDLDVVAKRSEDGKTLVLQVVNLAAQAVPTILNLEGFRPGKSTAFVQELRGPLEGVNVAEAPMQVAPSRTVWHHNMSEGKGRYTFPPYSFSILKFE